MYCPNCGKTNSIDQNFCRSCGFQLEKVVQSLVDQLQSSDLNTTLAEKRRRLDKLIQIIAGSTISIFVAAVLWGIIYSIIIVKGEVLGGLIFLIVILGLVLFGVLMLYRESLNKVRSKNDQNQKAISEIETAKLLSEPELEPVPSVTDRTTELLTGNQKPKDQTG